MTSMHRRSFMKAAAATTGGVLISGPLQAMFAEAGTAMDAFLKGDVSKIEEISGLGAKFQETSEAFQQICEP